jgi:squalene synthase HpnC
MRADRFLLELHEHGPDSQSYRGCSVQAFEYCRLLAARHYENFSVVSWLLPRYLRPHFCAVYAFCRWADDLADETGNFEQSRRLLDWWSGQIEDCYNGEPARHPVFLALGETIREFQLPREPFRALLGAFQQDQNRTRYDTVNELIDYCRGSANPVGRIVLSMFRSVTPERVALADSICTGLQWANFCQDAARDLRERGRIYMPRESWAVCGVQEADFRAERATAAMRRLCQMETERAERFLHAGWPLLGQLPDAFRRQMLAIVRGGLAICAAIRRQEFDVLARRPVISRWQKLGLLCSATWLPPVFWPQARQSMRPLLGWEARK